MSVSIALGTRFPAYAASMGRVLLAGLGDRELDNYLANVRLRPLTPMTIVETERLREVLYQIRGDGYSTVDQELERGLRSVAVPIHDWRGSVIAAMNVSAHATTVGLEALITDFLPALRATAREIESDLQTPRSRATTAR